jgi:apolipoprotein N-acyltransferase
MLEKVRDAYRSTFGHALLSAALLWAALPPVDLWPLAWVAPVWWVLLVRRAELAGKRPYRQVWLAGFLFWLAALHWLRLPHWLTAFGWVALAFYLAFYLPVFIGLSRVAVHRLRVPVVLAAPIVWTALELVRGHLLTGFTMASLGHTQYRWIGLIQVSDLAGAYGVGFVVMLVAACLARMVPCGDKPWAWWPLVSAAAVLGGTLVYGYLRISPERAVAREPGKPAARIALIQGSIDVLLDPEPGTQERMHRQYVELSQQAVKEAAERGGRLDLVIWPETVYGGYLIDYDPNAAVPEDWDGSPEEFRSVLERATTQSRESMRGLAERLDTPMLVGVATGYLDVDGEKRFNSAAFVPLGGGPIRRYDKMHLVVFGEYVPFAKAFDWLVRLTPLSRLGTADSGKEPAAFQVDGLRISPNICYESVIPHLIRRQVNALKQKGQEPDVLLNLTNDGWFWGSSELDMHLACAVFRAVECRKPFLVAANTGFSAWIDGDGRILAQGPRRATGVIVAEVAPDGRSSWYLAHGDWPAGTCLLASLVFVAIGLRDWLRNRPRRKRNPVEGEQETAASPGGTLIHKSGGHRHRISRKRDARRHGRPPHK